jgi:hypothetical protein
MRGRLKSERHHLGVSCGDIGAPEGFDTGLQNFARAIGTVAEHRAQIRETLRAAGCRRGEIGLRDGDGEIGTQAEIVAGRIGRQKHAGADVFAREIEKRFRGLQDGRRHACIAGTAIGRDQRFRARVQTRSCHVGPAHLVVLGGFAARVPV